ncbi:MAG: hypothetical protein LQ343_006809 [Gyalolechia ehrenbergii]|nr:MAG: hypothetical protein LQ343_006809 [Gyalolechia ehrenbergii]
MPVPNPSPADQSSAPPPYTSTTNLGTERPNSSSISGLRGGDAQSPLTAMEPHFSSAAVYFDDRPCTTQYPSHILNHTITFSPSTKREDFPFPQPEDQYKSRDVSFIDWNTFLNYLLPIDVNAVHERSRLGRSRSKDACKDRDRIEAVLAEWHEGFFGPRGIRIEAWFHAASHLETSPPPPFTSTVDVGYHTEASQSANQRPSMPLQPQMPSQTRMPSGQSPTQWARDNILETRLGSGLLGRLLSGNGKQNPTLQDDFRSWRERHKHDMRVRRGRSSSSSSTSLSSSSSSPDSEYGGRGAHHRRGRHGSRHHGHGTHHHGHGDGRRRCRSSSTSSSTSTRSTASLDFSRVDADEVRRSFVAMRQHLNNKTHLSTAVRQFKNEIRQSKRQHRDVSSGMRKMSKEQRHQLKAQGKGMKAELKSLVKEARAVRKADRKVRKAERKTQRARRRADRRGMDAHDLNHKAVAKAEQAIEANRMAGEKATEGKERAMAQEDREMHSLRRPEPVVHTAEQDLTGRTRYLGLDDTKKQASGVCPQNE